MRSKNIKSWHFSSNSCKGWTGSTKEPPSFTSLPRTANFGLRCNIFSSHDIDDNFNVNLDDNLDNNISDSLGNNLDDNVDENLGVVTTLTTTFWCQKNSINRYIEHWIRWIESWNNHFSTKAGPSKPSFNRLSRIKSKLMPVPSQGGAKLAADSPQCNMDSKVEVNNLKKNKQK